MSDQDVPELDDSSAATSSRAGEGAGGDRGLRRRSPSMTLSDVARKRGYRAGPHAALLLTLVELGYVGSTASFRLAPAR